MLLEPESRLTGAVLDAAGKPVVGARLVLSWGHAEMMTVPIDEKTAATWPTRSAPGKYSLSVIPVSARRFLHVRHAGGRQDARQAHPSRRTNPGAPGARLPRLNRLA